MAASDISVAIDVLKKLTDVQDKIGQVERDVKLTLQVTIFSDDTLFGALGTVRSVLSSCISQIGSGGDDVVLQIQRIQGMLE